MERKAKLLGLDAPTKSELTGKDSKPLFDGGEGLDSLLAAAKATRAGRDAIATPTWPVLALTSRSPSQAA